MIDPEDNKLQVRDQADNDKDYDIDIPFKPEI